MIVGKGVCCKWMRGSGGGGGIVDVNYLNMQHI